MIMIKPKYPLISVQLSDEDCNAYNVMSKVVQAMQKYHLPSDDINNFITEAKGGDYRHLLKTCMKYVHIE